MVLPSICQLSGETGFGDHQSVALGSSNDPWLARLMGPGLLRPAVSSFETTANTICTVLIFQGHWSSVGKRPKEFSLDRWLRSIERGFAQANNNHFMSLIRGVPEP